MRTTIWKYQLDSDGSYYDVIMMPEDHKILCVQLQVGKPTIWAEVDPATDQKPVFIAVIGTGYPLPNEEHDYIGTFQLLNGSFVFHVYKIYRHGNTTVTHPG